ncbi:LysR substrate-binding domain-containing protein [Leisingera daeponensis]|uniref:LysR substrate-binding domain-containing protein n=1 Tax=Leisingera daeponensis TaxID=405746 RepID=UPI000A002731|nr:LysR substrate-binding domain-containing protein [Leisingera daeponensis]
MNNLPLSLLRSLAAVHKEGGVRSAAKLLGVEHSAISRALRELELVLGAPLTEPKRRGQGLVLTSQARYLAKATLSAMKDLDQAVTQFRVPTAAKDVTIATLPSIAARWLMPKMQFFREAHPNIDVSIIVDQPRGAAVDPTYDLTLRMGSRSGSSVGVLILGDDVAFPVMAPLLWERLGKPTDVLALKKMRLLHDRDSEVNWVRWKDKNGPVDLVTHIGPRMTSSDLVLQAAELGHGIAICRGRLAASALLSGTLVRPFGELAIPLPSAWWLYEGERAQQRQSVRLVRDWLTAEFASDSHLPSMG